MRGWRTLAWLWCSAALAGQGGAPARQLPEDRAAFAAVDQIEDPTQKVAAYEKFLRDFPGAPQAYPAQRAIFETTVRLHRGDRRKVMQQASVLLKGVAPNDYGRLANALARHLHEENLYAKDAERLAKKAVEAPGPSGRRAEAAETLGQIYRRAGQSRQAERWLRRALLSDPARAASATALGEMAAAAAKDAEAVAWFAQARLAGPDAKVSARLEQAWRKQHGTLAGLETYLDERYRQLFPSPLRAKPYQKTGKRTSRVVLAEVHSGAGCRPCIATDLAIEAVVGDYQRQEVAVVVYHQHIPLPDPLTNDSGAALFGERRGRGVPAVRIDGRPVEGGGLRQHAAAIEAGMRRAIDERLEWPAGAGLEVDARRAGGHIQVVARLKDTGPGARLRLVLVEKLVSYSGENGVRFHPMVARSLHSVEGPADRVEYTFDLEQVAQEVKGHLDRFEMKDERHNPDGDFRFAERRDMIDRRNLAVVAYVEDATGVLQAAHVELRP